MASKIEPSARVALFLSQRRWSFVVEPDSGVVVLIVTVGNGLALEYCASTRAYSEEEDERC